MDQFDNDILLSAYLDGEVTVEERDRVERLLSTSTEARQLLEELRALRTSLQELPQHTLELDFAQRVLLRAQRELAGDENSSNADPVNSADLISSKKAPSDGKSAVDRPESKVSASGDSSNRTIRAALVLRRVIGNPRALGWSFVAVAIALMIVVSSRESAQRNLLSRRQPGGDAVAMAPTAKQPASAPGIQTEIVGRAAGDIATTHLVPGQLAADPENLRTHSLNPSNNNYGVDQQIKLGDRSKTMAQSRADAVAPRSDETENRLKLPASSSPASSLRTEGALAKTEADPAVQSNDDLGELLVVQVYLSPEAARRGDFDQLLTKNHIAMDEVHASAELTDQPFNRDALSAGGQPEQSTDRFREAVGRKAAEAGSEQGLGQVQEQSRLRSLKIASQPLANGKLDLIYVEASPEQIRGALADLREAPQDFPSVTLSADPSLEKQMLGSVQLRGTVVADPLSTQTPVVGNAGGGHGGGERIGALGSSGGFGGGSAIAGRGGAVGNSTIGAPRGIRAHVGNTVPAQNQPAREMSKEADLQRSIGGAERQLSESKIDKLGDVPPTDVPASKPARASVTNEELHEQNSEFGRAQRLDLPELENRTAAEFESAAPVLKDGRRRGTTPADVDATAQGRPVGGGGGALGLGKNGVDLSSGAPMPNMPANNASAKTTIESRTSAKFVDPRKPGTEARPTNNPKPNESASQPAGGSIALSFGAQAADKLMEAKQPRRALFLLRVLSAPAAAIPAAASVPEASDVKP